MATTKVASPEKPITVTDTSEKLDKLTIPQELKKMPTADLSTEKVKNNENRKYLDSTKLEELCSFKDEEFAKMSIDLRVKRLSNLRHWFWKNYGENAPEISGFIYSLSIESRLLSFLIARNFHLERTKAMIQNHVTWLAKYHIYEVDVKVVCPTAWKSGCWRLVGADKKGAPIIWIQAAIWKPKEYYGVDEYIYYICYMIENARRISMNNKKGDMINMIFDMEGFSMFTCDMECIKKLVVVLMDHFPESLKRAFVVNTNIAFKILMKLINYLLPNRTMRKMFILGSDDSMKSSLRRHISKDVLLKKYGGNRTTMYSVGPDKYVTLM